MSSDNLVERAKTGAAWLAAAQVICPAWEFGVGILLARVLTPKDFGIVAMGMIFFNLASALSTLGIGNVIIQRKDFDATAIATAQTIALGVGTAIHIALSSLSPIISSFFKEPLAGEVLSLFSWNFVINGIALVPASLLSKRMQFRATTTIDICGSVIYGLSAILIALLGHGLFSLVYSQVIMSTFKCVCLCCAASYLPRFGWHKSSAIAITKLGGTLTSASVLNYAARNADFFIVGKLLGASPLGLYKRAYDLAVIPKEKVADTLNRVFFSFVCKIQEDKGWTRSAFIKVVKMIALLTMPVLTFCSICCFQVVELLYGPKWLGAAQSFRFMALGGIFYSLAVPFGSLLIALGKSKQYLMVQSLYALMLICGTVAGYSFGIIGVSVAVTVVLFLFMLVNFCSVAASIGLSFMQFLVALQLPISMSLSITFAAIVLFQMTPFSGTAANFAIQSFSATVIYIGFIMGSKDSIATEFRVSLSERSARLMGHLGRSSQ